MIAGLLAIILLSPGDHDLTLRYAGRERAYIVHLPPRSRERGALPVIIAFHGGGSNAAAFKKYAGLDAVADREGVVVIYPDGSGGGRFHTFNAGTCCGAASAREVDDVGFALAILSELARELPLDPARVYATGHSNGAMMAYRLAVEASERIAAIAPVAGMSVTDRFPAARPMPVLHIHSVDDPRARYAGGLGPPFPGTNRRETHRAVEGELARWVAFDGCPAAARVAERREAPSDSGGANHTATLLLHAPCTSGAEVGLWKLTGAGHGWPGGDSTLPEPGIRYFMRGRVLLGPRTRVISAAEEMWKFFRRFARTDAPPLR